jgi:hypothetical protein
MVKLKLIVPYTYSFGINSHAVLHRNDPSMFYSVNSHSSVKFQRRRSLVDFDFPSVDSTQRYCIGRDYTEPAIRLSLGMLNFVSYCLGIVNGTFNGFSYTSLTVVLQILSVMCFSWSLAGLLRKYGENLLF